MKFRASQAILNNPMISRQRARPGLRFLPWTKGSTGLWDAAPCGAARSGRRSRRAIPDEAPRDRPRRTRKRRFVRVADARATIPASVAQATDGRVRQPKDLDSKRVCHRDKARRGVYAPIVDQDSRQSITDFWIAIQIFLDSGWGFLLQRACSSSVRSSARLVGRSCPKCTHRSHRQVSRLHVPF